MEKGTQELKIGRIRVQRIRPEILTSVILLGVGLYLVARAIYFSNTVMSFIAISLIFWGALLLYIRPRTYIRKEILTETARNEVRYITQLIEKLGYKGKIRFISPGTLRGLRTAILYVAESEESALPSDEQLSSADLFIEDPKGIKLSPPGIGLSRLIERELKTDFSLVDLDYLQDKLAGIITEELEITEFFDMDVMDSSIRVTIIGSIFNETLDELEESKITSRVGDPLSSAIACIIASSTRQPVIISKYERDPKSKSQVINYVIET